MKLDTIKYIFNNLQIRRVFLLLIDLIIVFSTYALLYKYSYDELKIENNFLSLGIIITIFAGILYILTGQYNSLTRYYKSKIIYDICLRNLLLLGFTFFLFLSKNQELPSLLFFVLYFWLLSTFGTAYRVILKDILLNQNRGLFVKSNKVAIYGAGSAGAQLAASIILRKDYVVTTFIDDSPSLWGRSLSGIKIRPISYLEKNKDRIDQVLIAIPSISSSQRNKLIHKIKTTGIDEILEVPTIDDILSGKLENKRLNKIDIDSLLSRDEKRSKKNFHIKKLNKTNILITGAGGSVGSELCRQIILQNPSNLIMLDMSEISLYTIDKDIKRLIKTQELNCETISILGNCCDKNLIDEIFKKFKINVIFHAAAYKHVPLVESNSLQGLQNNIFSTKVICEAAKKYKASNLVLISSDKAVRPTNVMGASKRLAELIVQAYSSEEKRENNYTNFSMVRFGNVLNSSGSVIPLFREQINKGGPITLTHPKIIRYFMTITEAAQLVINSIDLSDGGEVFLLDMGKPVLIYELAEQMIKLCGLTVKNDKNKNGDIEIKITGLRPGEKLYEELLIDSKSEPTSNELIFKANERKISYPELIKDLEKLEESLKNRDHLKSIRLLKKIVPEWIPSKEIQFIGDKM